MKGYWIAFVEVTDIEAYKEYLASAPEALVAYGANILARGDKLTALEGFNQTPNRAVVIEFDSYQKALDCYHSEQYQAAKKLREAAANAHIVIMQGQ